MIVFLQYRYIGDSFITIPRYNDVFRQSLGTSLYRCSTVFIYLLMYLFIEHSPESPTNAQPHTILQIQPIIRKTMVASCIRPTKQLMQRTDVRLMSGISRRVRKNAITPDMTVPVKDTHNNNLGHPLCPTHAGRGMRLKIGTGSGILWIFRARYVPSVIGAWKRG